MSTSLNRLAQGSRQSCEKAFFEYVSDQTWSPPQDNTPFQPSHQGTNNNAWFTTTSTRLCHLHLPHYPSQDQPTPPAWPTSLDPTPWTSLPPTPTALHRPWCTGAAQAAPDTRPINNQTNQAGNKFCEVTFCLGLQLVVFFRKEA